MPRPTIKYGDIFLVDYGEDLVGHEYQKKRPAVVIQSDAQIKRSNVVTVLPLSSNLNNRLAEDVFVIKDGQNLLLEDSIVKVHHIISFDYQRIYYKIGEVKTEILQQIKQYLKIHFGI